MNISRAFAGRFALYSSPGGDPVFQQLKELLAAGLGALGADARLADPHQGFIKGVDWHLVVAPHEFFAGEAGRKAAGSGLPEHLILLNTQRASGSGVAPAREWFSHARFIWDIDFESSLILRRMGHDCSYLPLGYVDGFPLFVPTTQPRRSEGLPEVLFPGEPSPRRDAFFRRHEARLAHCMTVIHPSTAAGSGVAGSPGTADLQTLVGLARRSRILLNVHRGADAGFDWHLNVLLGIAQRTLVVTEPCTLAPPFRAGLDFVEAPLEDLAERIEYYLASPSGLREAEEIVERGYRTLVEQCRLTGALEPLLQRLADAGREDWLGRWSLRETAPSGVRTRQPRAVCVVVPDLSGEGWEREQGAAQTALAQSLARMGHRVTVLHTGSREEGGRSMGDWYLRFAAQGIRYVALPETASTHDQAMEPPTLSYAIWLWLGMQSFDVVHFPDSCGSAFQSVLGKAKGLGLDRTVLTVNVQGPRVWTRSMRWEPLDCELDLEIEVMEKESIRLADAVVLPTSELREWMVREGWNLPEQTVLLPTMTTEAAGSGDGAGEERVAGGSDGAAVREIVFAGPLDEASGVNLFCDALDRLTAEDLRYVSVTFTGRAGEVMGVSSERYIWDRSGRWACPWRVLTEVEPEEVWDVLERPGQLVVFAGHFPHAVRRCMARGILFLSSEAGGIGELMAEESRGRTLFKAGADGLARAIRTAVAQGVVPVRPALSAEEMERRWSEWHDGLLSRPLVPVEAVKLNLLPRDNVILAGYDLTGRFGQAVAG